MEDCKIDMEETWVCIVNVEIIAIIKIYKVSVIAYFVTEGQVTESPAVFIKLCKRNTILLSCGELDNGHCYGLLPVNKRD
jgi:hypothetical protein